MKKLTYDEKNIFKKIINGEIPSYNLYEDENILSFLDAFPETYGHSLVIHKKACATNILDISDEHLCDIIKKVKLISLAIEDTLSPDGMQIIQYNGAPAGQTIFHIHFHIIPIWGGKEINDHFTEKGKEEVFIELVKKITASKYLS